MAQVLAGNSVKLNNGTTVSASNGGWYDGQQFFNGTLSNAGQINSQSNQQGAGQMVSQAVVAQTNPNNVPYLQQQGAALPAGGGGGTSGGGGGAALSSGPATPNIKGIYDTAYTNNPDVAATNQQIAALQKTISDKQAARDAAEKNINDDPFYAESTRTGKIAKLDTQFQNDINTDNNQLNTAQAKLTSLQADAQRNVDMATGQYNLDNQAYQQNLQEFNTLLSAGGLESADSGTLSQISASTGISMGMLQSIQQSQQAKNTQIISSTDNSGNVTIAAVNSQTGQVTHTETLNGVGKAAKGSSGSGGSASLSSSQQKKVTAAAAKSLLAVDNNKDKRLSVTEYKTAVAKVIAATGTDLSTANQYVSDQASSLGYQKWGTGW